MAVTARVRIAWVRFRKCGELLLGNRFPLKMKGKVYCCCVRSAIQGVPKVLGTFQVLISADL